MITAAFIYDALHMSRRADTAISLSLPLASPVNMPPNACLTSLAAGRYHASCAVIDIFAETYTLKSCLCLLIFSSIDVYILMKTISLFPHIYTFSLHIFPQVYLFRFMVTAATPSASPLIFTFWHFKPYITFSFRAHYWAAFHIRFYFTIIYIISYFLDITRTSRYFPCYFSALTLYCHAFHFDAIFLDTSAFSTPLHYNAATIAL